MFKGWVAQNPKVGFSSTGHIMRVRLLQGSVRKNKPAARASQEMGISPVQRREERQRRRG